MPSPTTVIAVTAATGELGPRVFYHLAEARKNSSDSPFKIVAIARNVEKAEALKQQYDLDEVRYGDYTDVASLESALVGIDRLLFISSPAIGERFPQHTNVVNAAVKARVPYIAYTSILNCDKRLLRVAEEHAATEELLKKTVTDNDDAFPMGVALIRHSFYHDYCLPIVPWALTKGVLYGSTGQSQLTTAPRDDMAAGDVAVVLQGEQNSSSPLGTAEGGRVKTYSLAGDVPYTREQLVTVISAITGRPLVYKDLPEAEYAKVLQENGLPPVKAASDAGTAKGALFDDSQTLSKLIGRPTTPWEETVKDVLSGKEASH